jgi:hypothetical protein
MKMVTNKSKRNINTILMDQVILRNSPSTVIYNVMYSTNALPIN